MGARTPYRPEITYSDRRLKRHGMFEVP